MQNKSGDDIMHKGRFKILSILLALLLSIPVVIFGGAFIDSQGEEKSESSGVGRGTSFSIQTKAGTGEIR
jgi:hypothetical protein